MLSPAEPSFSLLYYCYFSSLSPLFLHYSPQVATTSATLDDATSMRIASWVFELHFFYFRCKNTKAKHETELRSSSPPPPATLSAASTAMASPFSWFFMPFSICFLFSIDVVVSCPFLFHIIVVVVVAVAARRQTIKMMRCIARCCCPHPPIHPLPPVPSTIYSPKHARQHIAEATSSTSSLPHWTYATASRQFAYVATCNISCRGSVAQWCCAPAPPPAQTRPPKSPIYIDENDVQLQFVGFCCIFQGKNCQAAETAKWENWEGKWGKLAIGYCELATAWGWGGEWGRQVELQVNLVRYANVIHFVKAWRWCRSVWKIHDACCMCILQIHFDSPGRCIFYVCCLSIVKGWRFLADLRGNEKENMKSEGKIQKLVTLMVECIRHLQCLTEKKGIQE